MKAAPDFQIDVWFGNHLPHFCPLGSRKEEQDIEESNPVCHIKVRNSLTITLKRIFKV